MVSIVNHKTIHEYWLVLILRPKFEEIHVRFSKIHIRFLFSLSPSPTGPKHSSRLLLSSENEPSKVGLKNVHICEKKCLFFNVRDFSISRLDSHVPVLSVDFVAVGPQTVVGKSVPPTAPSPSRKNQSAFT